MRSIIVMGIPLTIVSLVVFIGLSVYGTNIFLSFICVVIAMTITASIITKIDLGSWNPF
jgi:hypothetical protein